MSKLFILKYKKIILASFLTIMTVNFCSAQVEINLEKENGIYKVPCKVNGIPMKFIFDTGASNVSISLTEAEFLLKQNLLDSIDIISSTKYQIANGQIIEGTKINIRKIEIDKIILKNTIATVVHSQNAPLLLGMSAIDKLGKISIENNKLLIYNTEVLADENIEVKETIDWINGKFKENSAIQNNRIEKIQIIDNEPFIILTAEPGICEENIITKFKIPIKKLKPISFIGPEKVRNSYKLYFELKNNEEITWFKDNEYCAQISNSSFIYLSDTIENNDLISRLEIAFNNLMLLYGNDGKEKF